VIFAKLDVCFYRHTRFHRAGLEASGLWAAALAFLRENDSQDGTIAFDELWRLFGVGERHGRKLANRLVEVGLFEPCDRGYVLCRYAAKNETREDIEARRAATAKRVAGHRAAKRAQLSVIAGHESEGNTSCNALQVVSKNALQPSVTARGVPGSGSGSGSVSSSDPVSSFSSPSAPSTSLPDQGSGVIAVAPLALVPSERRAKAKPLASPDVWAVFGHWAECRKRRHPTGPDPVLDEKRAKVIADRLREGHSVETLKLAVEGIWCSAFHLGQNDREREYTSIAIALRDGQQVEDMAEKALKSRELDTTKGQAG
jgi:hypothetical protein